MAAVAALGGWVVWAVARDAGPVDIRVDPTPRSAAVEAACRRFAEALPDDLDALERRRLARPVPAGYAAYGDPAVVVRCGVPVSTDYRAGDQLIVINGVAWDIDENEDGSLRCSLPRAAVNVDVVIPGRYKAERLSLLTDAVKQAQPF